MNNGLSGILIRRFQKPTGNLTETENKNRGHFFERICVDKCLTRKSKISHHNTL
jgi:hypothetical protein